MDDLLSALTSGSLVLAASIFAAELCVVTLGTMRIIFIARGMRVLAPVLGFFEITIWLFAISQIMQNLSNVACYASFAAGFTAGNYLGIFIERRLAMGTLVVRIITNQQATELFEALRAANYGVTRMEGEGAAGPVQMIFTVIKRKELERVAAIIHRCNPKAFYSVDEIQSASQGIFPAHASRPNGLLPNPLRLFPLITR